MKTLVKIQLISILALTTVALAWAHDIGLLQHNPPSRIAHVGIVRPIPRTATPNLSLLNFGSMAWSLTAPHQTEMGKNSSSIDDANLEQELVSANPADRSAAIARLLWLNHLAGQSADWRPKSISKHELKNL